MTHIARYVQTEKGWRYVCDCGHRGGEVYAEKEHARKAFHAHAGYAARSPGTVRW